MSLQTDTVFLAAIAADSVLMERIGGRLWGTAIPLPDEELDNTPCPYVIVTYDGMSNDALTKDNQWEGDCDKVNVGVLVAATTLETLHEIAQRAREAITAYVDGNETEIEDYTLTASSIQYDGFKPCYWQTLNYQCDTSSEPLT